jgi:hypothetical protein
MAEFPEIPIPPQPRKSNPWKIVIPIVVVVVLLCCLCLVVSGVLVYLGTQGKGPFSSLQNNNPFAGVSQAVTGDWDLYYTWSCDGNYSGPATLSLYQDGTFYAEEGGNGGYGTWTAKSGTLDYIYNESPYAHYVGTLKNTRDHVEGTMSTSDSSSGCFYADKR